MKPVLVSNCLKNKTPPRLLYKSPLVFQSSFLNYIHTTAFTQLSLRPALVPNDTQVSNEPENSSNGVSGTPGSRLSNKQLVFIMRLANERGLTKMEVDAHCINVFNVAANFLSKKEASTIIDEFNTIQEAKHV